MALERLKNFIDGAWVDAGAGACHVVRNPATGEAIGECPLGGAAQVDAAVQAAARAFPAWRKTPVEDRIQYLFKLKQLLEQHFEELAATCTRENGKTLAESRGSVRRGVQMVEMAAGAPSLLMGRALEDVAQGIDCTEIRQPLGVFAAIAPFNFPAMVPLWFFPFAVACGNTFVLKPSEQVPFCQKLIFALVEEAGFPRGVLNLVLGGKEAADALLVHERVKGVSFVGSSAVAEHVYRTATAHGKRVQALGGAKNFIIVMPDADMEAALDSITESACGCAGERCLAAAVVAPVGGCEKKVREGLLARMRRLHVGDGARPGVHMGPLISAAHKQRVLDYIARGVAEGAELVLDGRKLDADPHGFFVGPTLFDRVTPEMTIAREEIFGPVLCLVPRATLAEALELPRRHPLANASSIFTTSGKAARTFQYEIEASMAGVNIGVAAPMSFFGFGGAKGSFFGDLKAHGRETFDFYTDRKVVISRW